MAARAAIKMNHLILLTLQLPEEIRKCTEPVLMPGKSEQRIEAELWSVVFTVFFFLSHKPDLYFILKAARYTESYLGRTQSLFAFRGAIASLAI